MEELSASPEKSFSRSYVRAKIGLVDKRTPMHTASKRASSPRWLSESLLLPLLPPRQLAPGAQETFKARHASSDEAILKV